MTDAVLVTGGFGYIGGRVAQHLAHSAGFPVRLTTRRTGATAPQWLPQATIAVAALDDEVALATACKDIGSVVHLAALNEHQCAADPQRALEVNGLGTLKLLQAAQRSGVRRFIYFSTAHVYGAPLSGTLSERTPTRPGHPYAITHHVAEDFVLAARDRGSIEGIVVRMSNGFGAPAHAGIDRWTLIVNDLCCQAVRSRELVLQTSGVQSRDFITLSDTARAVEHLLHLPVQTCADGLFNLGGENVQSIVALAERVAARCKQVLGYTPALRRPQPAPGEKALPLDYQIDKLKQTGFTLRGDMDGEIDATLKLCESAFAAVNQ